MKEFIVLRLLLICALLGSQQVIALDIKVGIYPFAPFVETDEKTGKSKGVTLDLLNLLNKQQQEYHFVPVLISPKRRYASYKNHEFDVIFYESRKWGWQNIDILESEVYQTGGEVYVALKGPQRDQRYFEDLSDKRMVGMLGYHYGFAQFNSDEHYLRTKYNMALTWDNNKALDLILGQRGDVAVVTQAFLKRYLLQHPELRERLLVSDKKDQEYRHTALLRPDIPLTLEKLNGMIRRLQGSEDWQSLLSAYGISPQ